MPTVRTSTRIEAASTPGTSNGNRIRVNIRRVLAPHIRAADSTFGSICSMNGVIVSTTNGIAGTRLARITPYMEFAICTWVMVLNLYIAVASGMPYAIGGTMTGNRNTSMTARLPGNSRRASAEDAGTPTRTEMAT